MNITHARMIKHLPKYERTNKLIVEILRAIAIELDQLTIDTEQNYSELFIDTAIRALSIHERDLGIQNSVLTDKQRRDLIIAHYRATLEQTTDETIKNIAAAFSNGEVEINPTDTDGIFEIKFVGSIGIPDNMPGLMATLDIILPAHLGVIYTYVYNTWNDISHLTWDEAAVYTWDELLNEDVS